MTSTFNPSTKIYKTKGSIHPSKNALGGLERATLARLESAKCRAVQLSLEGGSVHFCGFETFKALSFAGPKGLLFLGAELWYPTLDEAMDDLLLKETGRLAPDQMKFLFDEDAPKGSRNLHHRLCAEWGWTE